LESLRLCVATNAPYIYCISVNECGVISEGTATELKLSKVADNTFRNYLLVS